MTDSLYRISLKCLITNDKGEVLVVKETGRDWWDFPGGGMDYGEDIHAAIARELKEEVDFEGSFTYRVVDVDNPIMLLRGIWQLRIILEIKPESMNFGIGKEADEIQFMRPVDFKDSTQEEERQIYLYAQKALTLYHV